MHIGTYVGMRFRDLMLKEFSTIQKILKINQLSVKIFLYRCDSYANIASFSPFKVTNKFLFR